MLSDQGAQIDPARCQHCALCLSACRSGAWTSKGFEPIELVRRAIEHTQFSIACAPSGLRGDAIVPCLGAVDAGIIAYLGKRRIQLTLLGSAHCHHCPHGAKGTEQISLNLEAAAILRSAAQEEGRDWLEPVLSAAPSVTQSPQPERRQLFRRLVGGLVDAGPDPQTANPPVAAERAIRAAPYVTSERRELLQIVCERTGGQPTRIDWHEALPLMQLTLEGGCTNCEACFRVCPTGALQIVENPGEWALTFQIDRCVGCAVCLEVCQPGVLRAVANFDARPEQPARILHALAKQRCARCDRFFVSPSPTEICPVCRDDEEAFLAIFGR